MSKIVLKPGLFPPEKIKFPISFGKTLPQLLSGTKTVTRRTWNDRYAQIFIRAFNEGKLVPAFDKDRRYEGKLIGYLRLTERPKKESIYDMPLSDLAAEGFPDLTWKEFVERFFKDCLDKGDDEAKSLVWVVRFQFLPLQEVMSDEAGV
jgi:hypothetical protein